MGAGGRRSRPWPAGAADRAGVVLGARHPETPRAASGCRPGCQAPEATRAGLASSAARGGRRPMATTAHRFDRSFALHARAAEVLAGGVSTAFRAFERPVPLTLASAQGARLTDVDGNELVDFVCGMGPIILGHGHPHVVAAVSEAAGRLQQAGAQSEAEVALAEQLRVAMPSLERLRFGLSGSAAVD